MGRSLNSENYNKIQGIDLGPGEAFSKIYQNKIKIAI